MPSAAEHLIPARVEVTRQPAARPAAVYEPPALLHVGDEIESLLAVRLDPTQEESDDDV